MYVKLSLTELETAWIRDYGLLEIDEKKKHFYNDESELVVREVEVESLQFIMVGLKDRSKLG